MKNETDVLIVGAGPTGLMMACQLALRNIPFQIIDKNEDHTTQSRALVVQARSMEIFDQMGIADKAIANGKIAGSLGAFFNGKQLVRMNLKDVGKGLTKFPYLLMLEQSRTEKLLLDFLEERHHHIDRQTELVSFQQDDEKVTATIKQQNGKEEVVTAKYLIGADGAHSAVRHTLDLPFGGKTYPQSMFVIDCKVDIDLPKDEIAMMFTNNFITGFFPMTNGRYRVLGTVPEKYEGKDTITFDEINEHFSRRVDKNFRLHDPLWISMYHSHHRYVSTFRVNRCFLAGDAAHIHSPVGGQGMNTGLQDAYNLSWKLALVLQKKAKEELLDTYTQERIAVAKQLVETTDRIFGFMTNKDIFVREARQYGFPNLLKIIFPLVEKEKFIRQYFFKVVSEINISYLQSSLSQDTYLKEFSHQSPKAGQRIPYLLYKNEKGQTVDIQANEQDIYFHLFVFTQEVDEKLAKEIEAFTNAHGDLLKIDTFIFSEKTKNIFTTFGIIEDGMYLVRPDGYIAMRTMTVNMKDITNYFNDHGIIVTRNETKK